MKLRATSISGCYLIIPNVVDDQRGRFVKTYQREIFYDYSLETSFAEKFDSASPKGVLRRLHFQIQPDEHVTIVYCTQGISFDAIVDLRKAAPTYGQYETFQLSAENANMLYIPVGLAHGFYVVSEAATMCYKTSTKYSSEHDTGIFWNSVGIPWSDPHLNLSSRDRNSPTLKQFRSPF